MKENRAMHRLAIYPGSFDPLTNGHLSLIQRGLSIFAGLIVAVANNPDKVPLFSIEERKQLIRDAAGDDPRLEVDGFDGLLVDYAKRRGVHTVMRGLRAVSDFEYEFQLANMNRKLDPQFESVFVMTGEDYFYVSARLVREVARFGGDVSADRSGNLDSFHIQTARSPARQAFRGFHHRGADR
jgi:pantetheine-phosphate adenylyltransferase